MTQDRVIDLIESSPEDYMLFCELCELHKDDIGNHHEWRQCSRWIRFEEDVETSRSRWSKPYVANLLTYSVFQMKKIFVNMVTLLECEQTSWNGIIDCVRERLVRDNLVTKAGSKDIARHFQLPISHLYQHIHTSSRNKLEKYSEILRKTSGVSEEILMQTHHKGPTQSTLKEKEKAPNATAKPSKYDKHLMKKLPLGTEAVNIFSGSLDSLKETICVFIRLKDSVVLDDITEIPLPSRFIILIIGKEDYLISYKELGKCFGTLMVDEIFRKVALKAENTNDLTLGLEEFISSSVLLPPSEWENSIRLEPPENIPISEDRLRVIQSLSQETVENSSSNQASKEGVESNVSTTKNLHPAHVSRRKLSQSCEDHEYDDDLRITHRIFGGLRDDIKRKIPFYFSDIKDFLNPKCFASLLFIYFACLAPIITFGGMLYQETGGYLGTMESIFAGALTGTIFAAFSGQPLIILGSTGPLLLFEKIIFTISKKNEWDYLSFRLWIGIWIGIILLLCVMFDLSALVKYISRFTEELFAALIAVIYIIKAVEKLIDIHKYYEIDFTWDPIYRRTSAHCECEAPAHKAELEIILEYLDTGKPLDFPRYKLNESIVDSNYSNWRINWTDIGEGRYTWEGYKYTTFCNNLQGIWTGFKCDKFYAPDIFFFSFVLCFGTFILAINLKKFNGFPFFKSSVRKLISDFSVLLAILTMTLVDYFLGIHSLKLNVPSKFEPTLGFSKRGWYVPFFNGNPWYTSLIAIGPAILGALLIFMDQQITAVIINRKDNKLKKGSGYHLDLLVVVITIVLNSLLGLPWFVAATVLSVNHVLSLKVDSHIKTPGEKTKFQGIIEQRVTAFVIFLLIGLSTFMTPVLQRIPMPVLYGIFLYMGVAALKDISMFYRFLLFFMPVKYQPDYKFLRHVRLRRVHLYTAIQVLCFILLMIVKSISEISILFPIMVVSMCFVRKLLDHVFSQHELKYLDGLLPPITCGKCCKKQKDDERSTKDELENL